MKKTLGGHRLGAGKDMKVELHGYSRSTHDMGYLWRSTMSAGTLVPFLSELALPGDTFDIGLALDVKTLPTIGPLFGSYKVQLDVFCTPIRLYNAGLHNNMLNIGMDMSKIKLPQLKLKGYQLPGNNNDPDNYQINPSALLSYLGIRGVGQASVATERLFNAVPYLTYWDIYKNYYANKQEPNGCYVHTEIVPYEMTVTSITVSGTAIGGGAISTITPNTPMVINFSGLSPDPDSIVLIGRNNERVIATSLMQQFVGSPSKKTSPGTTGRTFVCYGWAYRTLADGPIAAKPNVTPFALTVIDGMRQIILAQNLASALVIDQYISAPYGPQLYQNETYGASLLYSQEGLGIKTYQSDLFNTWLQTEWIDGVTGINSITAIDTSTGKFTLDTLNLSKKVYDMLNRIAVSGGSYNDWLDAVYTHDRYTQIEAPMYYGGMSQELVFQEVISNSETADQPLGTLAGRGILSRNSKGGKVVIKVDEPSYIMGIVSLTPRIDYSQGNKWDTHLQTMNDLHKPALDEIGFQELITEQMAWWSTQYDGTKWATKSAGKQPAWINYMTNVNQTRGNFAITENQMFMTLNRRYELDRATNKIKDLTTYIDPAKFNFIFAETELDAQNFWVQIAVDITARRKMSAKVMPNL